MYVSVSLDCAAPGSWLGQLIEFSLYMHLLRHSPLHYFLVAFLIYMYVCFCFFLFCINMSMFYDLSESIAVQCSLRNTIYIQYATWIYFDVHIYLPYTLLSANILILILILRSGDTFANRSGLVARLQGGAVAGRTLLVEP